VAKGGNGTIGGWYLGLNYLAGSGTSYGDILNFTTGSDKPEEDSIHYLPPLNLT